MDIVSKPNNDRHVLSFSRKLFLSVISLFLVFAVCFIAYQYQREKEYKVELLDTQLQDYNERLQQELRSTPDSLWTSVLNQYIVKGANKDLRVTIVNLHGDVLYDSYNETSQEVFNNHINRQEIQKALKNGKGYDLRRTSETTGIPYFYSATHPFSIALQRKSDKQPGCRPALSLVYDYRYSIADICILQIYIQTGYGNQPLTRVCQTCR